VHDSFGSIMHDILRSIVHDRLGFFSAGQPAGMEQFKYHCITELLYIDMNGERII
jgi:hypothetical protein